MITKKASFGDLFGEYMDESRVARQRSKTSLTAYRTVLLQWEKWASANGVDPLFPNRLEPYNFFQRSRHRRSGRNSPPSDSTQRREFYVLKSFFEWMDDFKDLGKNPLRGAQPVPTKLSKPKPVSLEVFYEHALDTDLGDSLRICLGLGWWMGLRRAEMAGLRCDALGIDDHGEPTMTFERKRTRAGINIREHQYQVPARKLARDHDAKGFRATEFLNWWIEAIERHCEKNYDPSNWSSSSSVSFVPHLGANSLRNEGPTPRQISYLFGNAYRYRTALPFTPHQLRHSFATNLARLLGDDAYEDSELMWLMGHLNYTTTTKYYDAGEALAQKNAAQQSRDMS